MTPSVDTEHLSSSWLYCLILVWSGASQIMPLPQFPSAFDLMTLKYLPNLNQFKQTPSDFVR